MFIEAPVVDLFSQPMQHATFLVEQADALANGKADSQIRDVFKSKHGGALEHVVLGIRASGISRALTHELRIHRYISFTQAPQYKNEDIKFVLPIGLKGDLLATWKRGIAESILNYEAMRNTARHAMVESDAQRIALSLLPQSAATEILMTASVRAWRKLLKQRGNLRATPEMRRLMSAILAKFKEQNGVLWRDCLLNSVQIGGSAGQPYISVEHGDM